MKYIVSEPWFRLPFCTTPTGSSRNDFIGSAYRLKMTPVDDQAPPQLGPVPTTLLSFMFFLVGRFPVELRCPKRYFILNFRFLDHQFHYIIRK
uniref:Uncharacterized protein n=1 Tax=Picea glauca TaxID=3330 RepID=A0A101M1J6_PICGL|nr:hypothetical protein ABT39_MTgene3900 [Picea glauca]